MKLRKDVSTEFVLHQTKSKIKNPWKMKFMNCLKCGKKYRELPNPDIINKQDGSRIELELIQACKNCFKKILQKERKRQMLLDVMSRNLLTTEEYEKYTKKKISEKELNDIINKRRKKEKKENYNVMLKGIKC